MKKESWLDSNKVPRFIKDFHQLSISRLLGLGAIGLMVYMVFILNLNGEYIEAAKYTAGLVTVTWGTKLIINGIKNSKGDKK